MATTNPLLDDIAGLMTGAMGAARAASEEAKTAAQARVKGLIADMDLAGRDEVEALNARHGGAGACRSAGSACGRARNGRKIQIAQPTDFICLPVVRGGRRPCAAFQRGWPLGTNPVSMTSERRGDFHEP